MSESEQRRRRARAATARRRRQHRRRRIVALLVLGALGGGIAIASGGSGGEEVGGAGERDEGEGQAATPTAAVNAEPRGPYEGPVPILMYHVIATAQPGTPDPELWVNKVMLERQMRWLADRGFSGVTLDQVYEAWFEGGELPGKPIVISFDDGLLSQYTDGLPVMEKFGWPGVLNLKVESLTQGELTDGQVKKMIAAGWEIGSHTITHADVSGLDGDELRREVAGSREVLRRRFGVPVNFFCYPAGRYDANALEAVEAAGYRGATTVEHGLANRDEMFELKRIRVNASDGVRGMAAKVRALTG